MSKLLKRALKLAITPATLFIVGKLLSLALLIAYYNMDYSISSSISEIFSIQVYLSDYTSSMYVNSVSNFLVFLIIGIPALFMIIKRSVQNNASSNPKTVVKLTRVNILNWVTKKDTTFLQTFIWTAFLWIISSVIVVQTLTGNTYSWMGITAGVVALLSAWGVLRTFEVETAKIYPKNNEKYL